MNLELNEFRALVVLGDELHFGRAAAKLHVSQPALTKQIKRMEAKLGGLLFNRSTGGVTTTLAGSAVIERARSLLLEAQSVFSFAEKAAQGYTGTLRIGFGLATIAELVPRAVISFRKQYPKVHIEMRDMSTQSQVQALLAGSIDVGFVRLPRNESEIASIPIQRDELVIAAPVGSDLQVRQGLRALRDQDFLLISRSASLNIHDHAHQLCRNAGFAPRIVQELEELFTLLQLVRSGLGVSLVPASSKQLRVPGLRFLSTGQKQAFWTIGIARSRKRASPLIEGFVATVQRIADTHLHHRLQTQSKDAVRPR
ncbi:MAG TPA: LysR substrate-binding domain-containing protein [Bryobacteraceae bacterium]|jgi:DNA-binding transcriptional LysR family regulator